MDAKLLSLCVFFVVIVTQIHARSTDFLPIVDLTELTDYMKENYYKNGSHLDTLYHKIGLEMGKALSTFGFLYLIGHGIDEDLINHSFQTSKDFFVDQKNHRIHKQWRRRSDVLLGEFNFLFQTKK